MNQMYWEFASNSWCAHIILITDKVFCDQTTSETRLINGRRTFLNARLQAKVKEAEGADLRSFMEGVF